MCSSWFSGIVRGGIRLVESVWSSLLAIFLMPNFYRYRGVKKCRLCGPRSPWIRYRNESLCLRFMWMCVFTPVCFHKYRIINTGWICPRTRDHESLLTWMCCVTQALDESFPRMHQSSCLEHRVLPPLKAFFFFFRPSFASIHNFFFLSCLKGNSMVKTFT